jgi:hypothetical protein
MCTVSLVPGNNGYFLTSNRDEKRIRGHAVPPAIYHCKGARLLYPKDADAGGTWMALNDNGNAAVLLNGGFIKHLSAPPYERSRGLVLLDIIAAEKPFRFFSEMVLTGIEPFTVVILEQDGFYECRWDGINKHLKQLRENQPYIWSSVTLYDADTIRKREVWFEKWIAENPILSQESILAFHRFTGDGDKANDLCMNRDGKMLTVSITSIGIQPGKGIMQYHDLGSDTVYRGELLFSPMVTIS